ncbi:MAG: GNAT family N-acetyltransferase [Gammaproteobacteria bacterium]|nr:GNAT family N-acetyltransferase [Gammaproteobacteria bacterium]MCW8983136.1 GNAT family N-acetyltransferase [Gammaproteobacteria bacterium]
MTLSEHTNLRKVKRMLTYRQALISEVQEQIEPLAKKHLEETDNRLPDFAEVSVNFDLYKAMEVDGICALFVAEDGEKVVGYLCVYVVETPHIQGYLQAVADALYVDNTARKGRAATELIKMAEQYARDMSCSYMTLCFKANNPHKLFCNSIGYKEDDIMYSKSLDV